MHSTKRNHLSSFFGRTAAVTFLAVAGTLGLNAQQSAGTSPSLPPISLKSTLTAPLVLSTPDDLNYSSSVGSEEMANAETFNVEARLMKAEAKLKSYDGLFTDAYVK